MRTKIFSEATSRGWAAFELLRQTCNLLEFATRFTLVNIPSYLLAFSPELDRMCSMIFAYLTFQLVGLCWAFLVNAAFALACRVTSFLPKLSPSADSSISFSTQSTTIEMICAFYVSYASIRVVISFGQAIFHLALESIKDFPDASAILSKGGIFTLHLTPIIFVPALVLEVGLLGADFVCKLNSASGSSTSVEYLSSALCNHTGLYYLTSQFPEIRRLVFYSLVCMVVQIWQTFLHQFPKWNAAVRDLTSISRLLFQSSAAVLSSLSILTIVIVVTGSAAMGDVETSLYFLLLGWTFWLFLFAPVLVTKYGAGWAAKTTTQSLQALAAYLRISHMCIISLFFVIVCFSFGFLRAQLDLTVMTIVLPALYCFVYLLASATIRAGPWLLLIAVPLALISALLVKRGMLSDHGGRGSVLLVFIHILGKIITYFGEDVGDGHDSWTPEVDEPAVPLGGDVTSVSSISLLDLGDCGEGSAQCSVGSMVVSDNTERESDEDQIAGKNPKSESLNPSQPTVKTGQRSRNNNREKVWTECEARRGGRKSIPDETALPALLSCPGGDCGNRNGDDSENDAYFFKEIRSSNSLSTLSELTQEGGGQTADSCHNQEQKVPVQKPSLRLSTAPIGSSILSMSAPGSNVEELALLLSSRGSSSPLSHGTEGESVSINYNTSIDALNKLAERGQADSSLVAIGLPSSVSEHWLIRTSRHNLQFIAHVTKALVIPDSVISGVLKAFVGFGLVLALMLGAISVASFAQESFEIFPKLIDFIASPSEFKFDHKVANVSLVPSEVYRSKWGSGSHFASSRNDSQWIHTNHDTLSSYAPPINPIMPFYAACDLHWKDLTLLDMSLLSEVAYFDYDDCGGENCANGPMGVQKMLDNLFPHLDLVVRGPENQQSTQGPRYIEIFSEKQQLIVLAIRGTDVGRLHDFMEDVKLFAEPVIFTLLSAVFPTIRLWSHDTTSRIIEWLYESNSFFGLQGESEYYRPLVQRVIEITAAEGETAGSPKPSVVLTGHSLGAGLARIVGTLTGQASVSFSPPGLELSYRKYTAEQPDGTVLRVDSRGAMHHHSVAVVTEFDWITQVDHQVGMVQRILCDKHDQAHANSCHLLEGTICHLLEHCGDPAGRFSSCDYRFDLGVVAPSLVTFVWTHRWLLLPTCVVCSTMFGLAVLPDLL